MKTPTLIQVLALGIGFLGGGILGAQAPAAPEPLAKAGIMIEPVQGKGGPGSKITNRTAGDLAIQFGKNRFILKPGDTLKTPTPQQGAFDFKVFDKGDDGQWMQRFESKAGPKDPKRFIPFHWAKPNQP